MHTYDLFGWFSADEYPTRQASHAPDNLSMTTTVGELRANWTGYEWKNLPYVAPVITPRFVPVPEVVSMRQARLALHQFGLLSMVQAAISALPGDDGEKARIEWEFSQEFRRDWPTLVWMSAAIGLTDNQVDDLFRLAATF